MRLPTKQRRMIIAIFSSSIIVTIVSILRAVDQIMHLLSLVGVATDFEVCMMSPCLTRYAQAACSTITCNLLVVATLVYRFSRRVSGPGVTEPDSEDDDYYTTPVGAGVTTPALTTTDFSALYCSEDSSQQGTGTSEVRLEHSSLSHQGFSLVPQHYFPGVRSLVPHIAWTSPAATWTYG
ncbi:hypothetical protein OG21DRAFT_509607 [Imleria badia]|nr:hypothetical protein OG21DRAFT_509607 [Imleria badia]